MAIKEQRNSNIELLRICSMFMIVIGHFTMQNVIYNWNLCLNDYILYFMGSGARISTNIFLIISVYFMCDTNISVGVKISQVYGQVIYYTYPLTIFSLIFFRNEIALKSVMRSLLPFWGRGLWFASAYITLILFVPILNQIEKSLNKKSFGLLVILCFIFVSFIATLPDLQSAYICDSMWFIVVYLIISYTKKYKVLFNFNKYAILAWGGNRLYDFNNIFIFSENL